MKAVILVAGKGTRMEPLTLTTPKCLLPVLNKPILLWQVEALAGLVDEIVLVIRDPKDEVLQQQIVDYASSLDLGIKFSFVIQKEARGTGEAFLLAQELLQDQERFFVLYGDDIYGATDLQQLSQNQFGLLGKKVSDPEKWGILQVDEHNNLQNIVEKPQDFVGDLANCGAYLLGPDIFNLVVKMSLSSRGEYELTDLVSAFAVSNSLRVIPAQTWIPVGYPWHLLEAAEQLVDLVDYRVEGEIEPNVVIKGRVKLGKGSIIKSGTYIEGDLVVGENCIIGPNAYLRKTNAIGNNCQIGFSVEVKDSVLMDGARIDHLAYLPDSVLGKNVGYACGTITADLRHDGQNIKTMIKGALVDTGRRKFGTVIGDGTKLGIKTIIYPGRKIWPNQSTLPGQVVDRDITN